jgi:hypothetical protein
MRRVALSLLAGMAVWVAVPSPSSRVAAQIQPAEAFSTEDAMGHVRRLAGGIGPRPAGSAAYRRAMQYVRTEFDGLGYDTSIQGFRLPQGGRSWNVVALPADQDEVHLLLGAHLDTVRGSPGGNDNASGVAVLLELARILAPAPVPGLALVAFGAEEFQPVGGHHIGSAAYVHRMSPSERDALEVMVSADMVGKARPFIAAHLRGTAVAGARELARAVRASGSRASVRTLGDISDHGPFALAGMRAAFLWTGDEPNHHRPTDAVKNVAPRALRRSGEALLALIDRVL